MNFPRTTDNQRARACAVRSAYETGKSLRLRIAVALEVVRWHAASAENGQA